MEYQTIVIIAPIRVGRKTLEQIEYDKFNSIEEIKECVGETALLYPITDFMDAYNNDELNIKTTWMGYVRLNIDRKI